MWKKSDLEPSAPSPSPSPNRPGPNSTTGSAVIGPSIAIKGTLTGQENLRVLGRVEGEIALKKHNVTVGPSGHVQADIQGRTIEVEGTVIGNLHGEKEVVIRASGQVQGNIVAPKVILDNGSRFKGSIDMESALQSQEAVPAHTAPKAAPASTAGVASAPPTPSSSSPQGNKPGSRPTSRAEDR